METLAGIFFLTTLIEGLITYVFGTAKIEGESGEKKERPYIRYVSLALGVAAAFAYGIDIPAMAGLVSQYSFVGYLVSGLVIGRGSNYVNDILGSLRKS